MSKTITQVEVTNAKLVPISTPNGIEVFWVDEAVANAIEALTREIDDLAYEKEEADSEVLRLGGIIDDLERELAGGEEHAK